MNTGPDEGAFVQETRVFKAGNSLAFRIPSGVAKRLDLEEGASVEMAVSNGMIYVRKASSQTLASLVERITPENIHDEAFDSTVGRERW